ncbi:PF05638 family protein [Leptospira weilii str. Ecochallenge]|uniref:PF05638 family protein n=1 Tax=Leptospira weilii str. Ecochallenge TaxID=1049986 RepID=N1TVE2_9LEPT|nr:PF05638 family protein [Leptospira weilii str. Ecochallenge]
MIKIVCFLITFLSILPLNAEEIDFVNKIILKITDTPKEGDRIQFEVLSYNHGVSIPLMAKGHSYRPVYQDYTVTKYLDLYSAYLLEKCARGGVIPEILLTYYQKSNDGSSIYKALEVQMLNAIDTSVLLRLFPQV